MSKIISVLGSTGSIGEQALDVARKSGYRIKALAAGKNIDKLEAQAREFMPEIVAVFDPFAAAELKNRHSTGHQDHQSKHQTNLHSPLLGLLPLPAFFPLFATLIQFFIFLRHSGTSHS